MEDMEDRGRWSFVPGRFNRYGLDDQLGSIRTPDGMWFAAVEDLCSGRDNPKADLNFVYLVVAVLNRELPEGKLRVRRKKGKNV